MNDKTKDFILYGAIILIFLYLLRGKQIAVVTVKINPPIDNTGTEFDYSVCGISPDVIKNGLPIKYCIDPGTGLEHSVSDYPNGNTGQVVFLRDQTLVDRSNTLNGVSNG
jgi:hypothetical protein